MNSSNNAAASSRRSDSNMDCGSLLPLSPGSPAADKGQTTLDGQQAGLPKAVAGCRSPRKWLRRLFWTVVTLVSLLTVYYQWENRRSARELQLAREHLLERIGTENWLDLAPPVVPDEQNFFALPVIEQWMHRDGRQVRYVIPKNVFLPPNFVSPAILENEADGTSRVDFAGWAKNRDLKGESPAIVMNRELGDGNGLLPKLAAGLSRPFSAWKPHQHDELAAAGADPYDAIQPHVSNVNDQMRQLGLHLRVAAAAGDVEKARSTALILLRLFPESASSRQCLIGSLVSIATHGIAFEALQDALSKPAWDENGLHALQLQLGRINDLEVMEQAMSMETLTGYGVGLFIRESCRKDGLAVEMLRFGQEDNSWLARIGAHATRFGYIYGPVGWHDANTAFFAERFLDLLGPKGETAWLDAGTRATALKQRLETEYRHIGWNMRRKIGAVALPNIGNLFPAAAETLFHRRCLIIACELEKHRLTHGAYPASLDAVKEALKPFPLADPAKPSQLPGYRLEQSGYVLSSVRGKSWDWRIKRGP
ncbi:MAG: hypothetical protein IAE77_23850 [Prosthecobacter sp.]|jgi:hypothetical protein|uniref:hypothetical protein n=1 Tax=Prosthecobacter sp. TaxID=1965333 RepID=UPI0019E9CFE3|nr:hypothetical protein [Prosthecobacter sp.]MBE2286512.1 hypothetical protein [Prosthecobacter sp.]